MQQKQQMHKNIEVIALSPFLGPYPHALAMMLLLCHST